MARVEPESSEQNNEYKYNTLFKYLAVLTMPLEGAFFFGTIMGWPNLGTGLSSQFYTFYFEYLTDANPNTGRVV